VFDGAVVDCEGTCGGTLALDACDECGGDCVESNGECTDLEYYNSQWNETCATFDTNPGWCGDPNDSGGSGYDACCACGGGEIAPSSFSCGDGSCDCEGNVEDCAGECGGSAVEDCANVCGDGWTGVTWSSGDQSATLDAGFQGTAELCFDTSGANDYVCDDGSWQSEVSWTLTCDDGSSISGGAPESGCFGTGCV
jgi:hypothetical protein